MNNNHEESVNATISNSPFIDLFSKPHRVVHNGGFPKFLYGSLNMVNSAEIS